MELVWESIREKIIVILENIFGVSALWSQVLDMQWRTSQDAEELI